MYIFGPIYPQTQWRIIEGDGTLNDSETELVSFTAGEEPGLVKLGITATEGEVMFEHEALITVTSTLVTSFGKTSSRTKTEKSPVIVLVFMKPRPLDKTEGSPEIRKNQNYIIDQDSGQYGRVLFL